MVEGLDRMKRRFNRTIPDAVRKATRDAMEKGAGEIVAMAKNLAPVDSGDLRDSIGWTWGAAPKGSITLSKASTEGGETITIYAGNSEAFYARWVEFGHQNAAPYPFFFPSYRTLKRRVKGRITRAMKKAIRAAK